MNSKYTLIKNVNILTMNQNKDIIENGMVIYKDDKIVYSFKEIYEKIGKVYY